MAYPLKQGWYGMFKYAVYLLLITHVFVFFREEFLAVRFTYTTGPALTELVGAFAATIDTAAWVILLLLFELQTCVLSDAKLTHRLKRVLHGVRAVCYLFIAYAFYGYLKKCQLLYGVVAIDVNDLCALVDGVNAFMIDLDEYVILDDNNCSTFSATQEMLRMTGLAIYTDADTLRAAQHLSFADVLNSGTWILVALSLEADIRLRGHGLLTGPTLLASHGIKTLLYSMLLMIAVYWGLRGDAIDFWDALCWIVAFVFIEMNLFGWAAEMR